MMGLNFEEEPAYSPPPREKKKAVPKTRTVTKSLFTDAELQTIAKACHDYRKSHKRAEKWDPLTSLEAKAYKNAGIIIEKIGKALK